jgi:hypothetical protein
MRVCSCCLQGCRVGPHGSAVQAQVWSRPWLLDRPWWVAAWLVLIVAVCPSLGHDSIQLQHMLGGGCQLVGGICHI